MEPRGIPLYILMKKADLTEHILLIKNWILGRKFDSRIGGLTRTEILREWRRDTGSTITYFLFQKCLDSLVAKGDIQSFRWLSKTLYALPNPPVK